MARPERPIDPAAGPTERFAYELRELRRKAGSPTYRRMGADGFVSYSSLSRAAGGRRFPTWAVTEGFVRACRGDAEEWERRWREALREVQLAERPALPDPTGIGTVEEFRSAVTDIRGDRDLEDIGSAMNAPRSVAQIVAAWPEQVDLATFLSFLRACGATYSDENKWSRVWQVVMHDPRRARKGPPDPATVSTPLAMRNAIESMLSSTTVNAVAARMHTTPGTVGRVLVDAERVEPDLLERFVIACGRPRTEVPAWLDARRRALAAPRPTPAAVA
ncbi:MAG TPA: hypothetical protein VGD67_19180, partial [Pseudonocardiaceae bacterium]